MKLTKLVDGWYKTTLRDEEISIVRNNSKGWFALDSNGTVIAEELTRKDLMLRLEACN